MKSEANRSAVPLRAFWRPARGLLLAATLLSVPLATKAQTMHNDNLSQRIQQLEDKSALKTLVDTFSELADRKDIEKQVLLFTEEATVESYSNGRQTSVLKGRKQIGEVFGAFLGRFETVYHLNGQQTVQINGDTATGVAYCLVVLIGIEDGKTIKNTSGVYYNDEYVRRGDQWLIARRISHFTWSDKEVMAEVGR